MIARGKRRRSSSTRASRAAASGSGAVSAVTEVATMAMSACLCGDEPQLAQAERWLGFDGVLAGEAGVAEPLALAGAVAVRPLDRLVEAVQRQEPQAVGAHELADLVDAVV